MVRSLLSWCCFLMIRRPPRSTQGSSSAASDVYKRQLPVLLRRVVVGEDLDLAVVGAVPALPLVDVAVELSLIHISEPTRPY